MASQDGCREGEEVGHGAGPGEVKPGQMDLIAAMLAGMRQEMAVDHEAQAQKAHEQAQRVDKMAREQAQRADEQACHLVDVLQSNISSLKVETQQYTDRACDKVRSELLEKVQTLEGEVQGMRKVERQLREVATSRVEEKEASRVVAANTGVADLLGVAWGPWQGTLGPRSVVSEPVAAAGGWGANGTTLLGPAGAGVGPIYPASLPPSPHPPPPCRLICSPRGSCPPPHSPSVSHRSGRRRLAEYDGKVAWEAYVTQFEMLAAAQGWGEAEKVL
ncbi:uncharacterized protein LOC126999053 isoform X3 [Eriocheir sinensis]|uniref:uncharacterized protein LOC126999053 isoform X3 n=1 Tax=Eriocheir sinensis TaxID=95602 RepID=UPI0021C9BBBE|nr:uncharacterized protein LOC126999053 isoform X3 [Eriocheir sinensis]